MTDVTGKGGISAIAIGGAAAVVAVLGGVVFLQWGGGERGAGGDGSAANGDKVVITPSVSASDRKLASPEVGSDAPKETVTETEVTVAATDATAPAEVDQPAGGEAPVEAAPRADAEQAAEVGVAGAAETSAVEAAPSADETPAETPAVTLTAPQMDLARFETDGSGMVAGRATPGSVISLMLDGAVLETLTVPSDGSFVLFTSVAPSDQPQVISLTATLGEAVAASDAEFILAPVVPVAPVQVAQADAVEAPVAEARVAADVAADAAAEETATVAVQSEAAQAEAVQSEAVQSEAVASEAVASEAVQAEVTTAATETAEASPVVSAAPAAPVAAELAAEPDADPADVAQAAVDSPAEDSAVAPVEVAETTVEMAEAAAADVAQTTGQDAPAAAAPEQVAVLRSDASGVTLVQPPTPRLAEAPDTVALETISYDDAGSVVLSGRVRADAVVRAYLDNAAIADLPVDEEGRWSGILPNVAPGIYALRLDALDTEGKVLSRLETPFKREAPEVLQPPVETAAAPDAAPTGTQPQVRLVTVQEGDTLWAISRERYGDGLLYVRVFDANRAAIRNPDLIYPGQVFSVPVQ
ncbi:MULTISPECIES: LysM peptidoglycan-binding domain-containing protein [unclassified Phaeobacter]|uniref:LysM peptidoglycan-binding domain-containing protein n=1 Tax=unclassified Phaeobacter TaxID=2621772 RepID=UPI003A848BEB